jgi:hypothetical protein
VETCSDHVECDLRGTIRYGLYFVHRRLCEEAPTQRACARRYVDDARVGRLAEQRDQGFGKQIGTCRIDVEGVLQPFALRTSCHEGNRGIIDKDVEFSERFRNMRSGAGDMIIGLDVKRKKLNASWKFARLKVLESGVASFGRSGGQVNMVSSSRKELARDFEANAAVSC